MSSNHRQKQNHDKSATSQEEKIDQKQFEVAHFVDKKSIYERGLIYAENVFHENFT